MTITCPPLPARYEPSPSASEALLGSGGMADVFQARDRLLGDSVAIKVVRSEVMVSPEFQARFEREVQVSAAVVHSHLVPVHDLGTLPDGRPYLALALADAGSLLELRRTNPPWPLLRRLVDEVLAALSCLHARGILHLDVKLSNVLLHRDPDGRRRAWLSDLGLAKALARKEAFLGTLAGTLSYMPVEVLLRRYAEIGPPSDLFAVGVLLYRLISGTNPFRESTVPAHINKRYRPPRHVPVRRGLVVPEGLQEIILHLVQPDPRSRYDLAADVRAALAALPLLPGEDRAARVVDLGAPGDRISAPPTDMMLEEDSSIHDIDRFSFEGGKGAHGWNRPHPSPIPFRPPPEPGRGARARASLPLFSLREVPLVGRDEERQHIWDLARSVATIGRPQAILVRGEAGVGKSRLVRSVTRPLEEGGHATVVEVSFTQGGGPGDGYPGAVRRLLRLDGQDPLTARNRLERWVARDSQNHDSRVLLEATLLQRWGLPEAGVEPVSPVVAREYLMKHLSRHAWRGFSVLVIEDGHWCSAEDDGAALAATILQLGLPVLSIITARADPLDTEPAAQSAFRSLLALGAEEMSLERISAHGMADLVEECLPLEEGLAAEVVRRSEGNPLFARELIGQWCRQGVLEPLPSDPAPAQSSQEIRFGLNAPTEEVIPDDIRALLAGRLSNLIRRTRNAARVGQALDVVGVAGAGVPWTVLQIAAGAGLEELVDTGLVRNRSGVAAVDHPLMGQLLRERVRGRARQLAHQALAEAWSTVSNDFRAQLEVGRHELAGERAERAIAPLVQAVEGLQVAGSVGELRAAALELNRAVGGAGRTDRSWFVAQLALARTEMAAGTRQAALARLSYLQSLEPQGDMAVEVAAQYVETLEYEARARLGLPALEEVEPHIRGARRTVQARFYQARAACLLHLKRHGPAERQVRRALDVTDSEVQRTELLYQLGIALESNDPDEALVILGDAELRASQAGYRSLQAQALARIARVHGVQGRWEEGQGLAAEAERLALAIGFHSHVPLCRNSRAECLRFQGSIAEAETLYREGRGWASATGQKAWSYVFDLNLALCALLRGALTAFRDRLDAVGREDPCWEPFAPIVKGMEALWGALMGEDRSVVVGLPLDRILEEGLDGALVCSILSRAADARGWKQEAADIRQVLEDGMAKRGLRRAHLAPMMACYDQAMGEQALS